MGGLEVPLNRNKCSPNSYSFKLSIGPENICWETREATSGRKNPAYTLSFITHMKALGLS